MQKWRAWQGKEKIKSFFLPCMHTSFFSFSVVDLHRFVENESSWETVKGVMKKYFPHSSFSEMSSSKSIHAKCWQNHMCSCKCSPAFGSCTNHAIPREKMRTQQTMTSSLFTTSCDSSHLWRPYLWWGFISVQASSSMRGHASSRSSGASVFRLEWCQWWDSARPVAVQTAHSVSERGVHTHSCVLFFLFFFFFFFFLTASECVGVCTRSLLWIR
jgi:hypothetical protein